LLAAAAIGFWEPVANEHQVSIEFAGRLVTGTYSVWAGTITVRTVLGSRSADLGIFPPVALARIMLRDLAREGKA
jgi:hypothetical protein